jgi:hypothetical protein
MNTKRNPRKPQIDSPYQPTAADKAFDDLLKRASRMQRILEIRTQTENTQEETAVPPIRNNVRKS